jgi:hypothetical protein
LWFWLWLWLWLLWLRWLHHRLCNRAQRTGVTPTHAPLDLHDLVDQVLIHIHWGLTLWSTLRLWRPTLRRTLFWQPTKGRWIDWR